jgi:hypothetical protein
MQPIKEEKIKKVENKDEPLRIVDFSESVAKPDRALISAKIKARREKLEKIKSFIPLKTYNQISEKLQAEEEALAKKLAAREKQAEKENEFSILPKIFFEQKYLKPKGIRID